MEDEEEECCVPALVDLPSKAIQISAGDSHTAALTEDGHVYIWGKYIYIYYLPMKVLNTVKSLLIVVRGSKVSNFIVLVANSSTLSSTTLSIET